MGSRMPGRCYAWFSLTTLALSSLAAPAAAQWSRVDALPGTELSSIWANGDTIVVGADTAVFVSPNGGANWSRSARPVAGVTSIQAVRIRNGRLYAGTFGQGVFVSDDLGATWSPFNDGLVGGILDSQLDVVDFAIQGSNLLAGTAGAGVYARDLDAPGTWHTFGDVFEPNQASNVNSLALGGDRLIASAGANGMVFRRDPGDADWTISNLDNVGIHAGLSPMTAIWTGTGWVVGTNLGVFHSVAGQEPWTRTDPGLGSLDWVTFATQGHHVFGAFNTPLAAVIEESDDDGATWQSGESLAGVFVKQLAVSGNDLYAARGDGLWRRPTETTSVAPVTTRGLRFALAGPEPCRDVARLQFDLPDAGTASIEVFDVLGRAMGERLTGWYSPGPHESTLDARRLSPGVYAVMLTAGREREVVRLVRVQ